MKFKSRGAMHHLTYELTWTTKYKQPIFDDKAKQNNIRTIIQDLADNHHIIISIITLSSTTVQAIIQAEPTINPSEITKILKGSSAKIWLTQYPNTKNQYQIDNLWAPNYIVRTLGNNDQSPIHDLLNQQITQYNNGHGKTSS